MATDVEKEGVEMEGTTEQLDVGRYATIREAAAFLRVTERHMRRILREGRLRRSKPAGMKRVLILRSDLERFAAGGASPTPEAKEPTT